MTIGDEKVVERWSLQYVSALEGDFLCADPAGHYVKHDAYAELAAERDRLQTAYDALTGEKFSDRCHAALQSRATAAESQLAELRGRAITLTAAESDALSGLMSNLEHDAGDAHDCEPRMDDDEDAYWAYQQYQAIRKLRALAAADGG